MTSQEFQERLTLKMMERLEGLGSTLYSATWKAQVTPAQRLLFRVRASVRRTSDSDSTGLVTPSARDWKDTPGMATTRPDGRSRLDQLPRQATLAGWPTSTAQDASRGAKEARPWDTGKPLNQIAALAGWNAPVASDGNGGKRPHPDTSMTGKHPSGRKVSMGLASQVHIGFINTEPARLTASGQMLTGSTAGMVSGGQLNPAHSRWLMGLPVEWDECAPIKRASPRSSRAKTKEAASAGSAPTVTPSSRHRPKRSSGQ